MGHGVPGRRRPRRPVPTLQVGRTWSKDEQGRDIIVDRTKRSHVGRRIALSLTTAGILRSHQHLQKLRRLRSATWHDHNLVFDCGDGNLIRQSTWQRTHRAYCERAGVPVIRCHDLRHTSTSLEQHTGTDTKIVSSRLGHKNSRITVDTYTHVYQSLARGAAELLTALLETTDQPDTTTSASNR